MADGQIPISALLSAAKLRDSQVAIPLMIMTSQRVTYYYDLMDSAYDAGRILDHTPTGEFRAAQKGFVANFEV